MKKHFSLILLLCSALAFAETGLEGGADGLHEQSTATLGKHRLSAGLGASGATDSKALSFDHFSYDGEGVNPDKITPMLNVNAHFAFGILDFWDVGAVIPFGFDGMNVSDKDQRLFGGGPSDIQLWTKFRAPVTFGDVLSIAALAQVYFPTGMHNAGFKPRHQWYINSDGNTHAFTADSWTLEGGLIFTADFAKKGIPLRWNGNISFVKPLADGRANTLVWGEGLNYTQFTLADIFLELNGETRLEHTNAGADPMTLTPGVRFHFGYGVDVACGLDIGVDALTHYDYEGEKTDELVSDRHGHPFSYEVSGEPHYGVSLALNWSDSYLDKVDDDGDGVYDKYDACPHSPAGVKVDRSGCPLDGDSDGVPDYKDQCPDTPAGVKVDSVGCTLDDDNDGVANYKDKCPNTPAGVKVDSVGCPLDSDNDGVPDYKDKCPNTPAGAKVDSVGCPLDSDNDGVSDYKDKCPNTPAGVKVDSVGCPLDDDADGVANYKDKCPNTPAGVKVDSVGCPLDSDGDGVPDYKDKCPNTVKGVEIDSVGCPVNKKENLDSLLMSIGFKKNSAVLTKESSPALNDVVRLLNAHPDVKLKINGYASSEGTEEHNLKLSEDRAQAIKNYLVNKGISTDRLAAKGYGTSNPVAGNDTETDREKNRRVEMIPEY